ncbi:hypothetical protein FYK55_16575 [Roseiconus nitratireducens]|uniref:Peptidase C39-like protein n=1 Tax=Roseiconus nitratireducens TaxID=2605748 RepID=A0A5M6D6F1_9BACT|nr:hypothetical protein [Roseiconus nitratireducens]KAA5541822.1 hypothetical protein FYK55_16575 [Roseiconus nitratireducens]
MKHSLDLDIQTQPSDTTCGPTCLAAVYAYWGFSIELNQLIRDIGQLGGGGTLAVNLACDALRRGFSAEIVTYNVQLFDPSWFDLSGNMMSPVDLSAKLGLQVQAKGHRSDLDQTRLHAATAAFVDFLRLGGRVRMQPLDENLIAASLTAGKPILCGLSATYLYHEPRERILVGKNGEIRSVPDDIVGDPTGHFVVLHGYDPATRSVLVADPLHPNPLAPANKYATTLSRVASAILLGIVTYDANLLTISPGRNVRSGDHGSFRDPSPS